MVMVIGQEGEGDGDVSLKHGGTIKVKFMMRT